jgi:hypothetical protein
MQQHDRAGKGSGRDLVRNAIHTGALPARYAPIGSSLSRSPRSCGCRHVSSKIPQSDRGFLAAIKGRRAGRLCTSRAITEKAGRNVNSPWRLRWEWRSNQINLMACHRANCRGAPGKSHDAYACILMCGWRLVIVMRVMPLLIATLCVRARKRFGSASAIVQMQIVPNRCSHAERRIKTFLICRVDQAGPR